MASLGGFNAALNSFTAQPINALVNVNFEVNFAKKVIPPPAEYEAIGQNLSPVRRENAQDGAQHCLARKLGLLFKDLLPSTPQLIKAYGSRSSQIARDSAANPRGNYSHGPFSSWVGADSTTLWAAATSGRSAIQCHLLACLLARMWEAAEATSIWVEVTSRRQVELEAKLAEEGEVDPEVYLAMKQGATRSELRDWDASARAWLPVADRVMTLQQTQLQLIVDNMDIPVNTKHDTYESVIGAWTSAMTQMESLLGGSPLQVVHGDILLGLLSWHLYPDMRHLSTKSLEIKQNDPLLDQRGILSLGLEPSPRITRERQSVYWSLPLSYLRFYGRLPVTRTRSLRMSDRDRISVQEMLWAMLSAYIQPWDDGELPSRDVLQYVSDVAIELHWANSFEDRSAVNSDRGPGYDLYAQAGSSTWMAHTHKCRRESWLLMLSRIALMYKDRLGEERVRKIRNVGQRFCHDFSSVFQGIFSVDVFLKVARNLEDKINFLRHVTASMSAKREQTPVDYEFIVMYSSVSRNTNGQCRIDVAYATAVPEHELGPCGIATTGDRRHRRWIPRLKDGWVYANDPPSRVLEEDFAYLSSSFPLFKRDRRVAGSRKNSSSGDGNTIILIHESRRGSKRQETQDRQENGITITFEQAVRFRYELIHGDLDGTALLVRSRRSHPIIHQGVGYERVWERDVPRYKMTTHDVMQLFRPDKVKFKKCALFLDPSSPEHVPILGMTFIESLYGTMDNATIDIRAVQMGLSSAKWLQSALRGPFPVLRHVLADIAMRNSAFPRLNPKAVSFSECFACIAMLETGTYNLTPAELENVFALGTADSLFIASALLHDPAKSVERQKIQRFTGNIGKPGMVFLVPPTELECKSYDNIDEWYQYDHKEFDGDTSDCFGGTSLHLGFSDASQPINVAFAGGRDVEACFIEAFISVHDCETWVADVDILKALSDSLVVRKFLTSKSCQCDSKQNRGSKLISIDNYAEIIVPPKHPGIIRAKGNWEARLVAVTLCVSKGYTVVLKAEHTCWGCLSQMSVDGVSVESVVRNSEGPVAIL